MPNTKANKGKRSLKDMKQTKQFFAPIVKAFFFMLFTVGGAQIVYKEVIFPGIKLLPYGVYNPILDLDSGRFVFRFLFFGWSLLVYLFVEFFLSKHRIKHVIFIAQKHKWKTFFQGGGFGFLLILTVIALVAMFHVITFIGVDFSSQTIFQSVVLYLTATIATAFAFELVFRGYILELLAKGSNQHVAVLISTVLYASIFVHGTNDFYPVTEFFLGLLLGYGYLISGFYFVLGFHFFWDFIESIVYSNTIFHTILDLSTQEAGDLLNYERLIASIVLLIGSIFLLVRFLKYQRQRKG